MRPATCMALLAGVVFSASPVAAQDNPCADHPFAADEALECYLDAFCADAEDQLRHARCIADIVSWREAELTRMRRQSPLFQETTSEGEPAAPPDADPEDQARDGAEADPTE